MVNLVRLITMTVKINMKYLDKRNRLRLQPTLSTTNLAIEAVCWNGNGIDSLLQCVIQRFRITFDSAKTILQCRDSTIAPIAL